MLAGGQARPDLGPYFYEPTILEGVNPDMTCFGNETFGPVISLYRFHDEAEAVARANDGEYGLNASDLQPRHRARPGASPGRSSAARSTSTRRSAPRSPASTRRWAACASPAMGRRQGAEGILRYTETAVGRGPALAAVRPAVRHERRAVRPRR